MPSLSIIIVNFNTHSLIAACLQSFSFQPSWELIIVDNGSQPESLAYLTHRFPHAKFIKNKKNLGFAKANNQGANLAQGKYLWLLNSDTLIQDQAPQQLINYLDHHPKVAAVTPKIILQNGRLDLSCHRGLPTPWNAFTYFSRLESIFPQSRLFSGYHQLTLPLDQVHYVPATAATALMIRRALFNRLGQFDERFFFYGEDLDLCQRMGKARQPIAYYPHAIVIHQKSAAGKHHQNATVRRQARHQFFTTMKQYYAKHYLSTYPSWVKRMVYWGIDCLNWLSR